MQRVLVADVVPSGKLGDVAPQVLAAEMVKGTDIAPLDHAPERVDALGAHLAPDVFPNAVLDGFVVGEALITAMFVRVDGRVRRSVVLDKALSVRATGSATMRFVARSFAPTTTVLPAAGPVPCFCA